MANVYRFHELVGVNPPEGPTFYLTPDEAKRMIQGLSDVVQSVETESFGDSPSGVGCKFVLHDVYNRRESIAAQCARWQDEASRATVEGNEKRADRATRIAANLESFSKSLKP